MNILYIMCGIPGAGKSTIAKQLNGVIVSSDTVRKEMYGAESIQGNPSEVFAKVNELTKKYLKENNVIYDATSIKPRDRKRIMKTFPNARHICVYVATPFEECKRRNAERKRVVPMQVMERMIQNFVEPTLAEGFEEIIKVGG